MIRDFATAVIVIAPLTLVGGCVMIPTDAGFGDVQQAVRDRTAREIRWNRDSEADREVARSIHHLLAEELTADDAVKVALLGNQNLQATYEELGVAQSDLVEAGLLRNPSLGFDLRFPRFKAPVFPYDVDVTTSFIDLLTLPLRKAAAGAAFEAAKQRAINEVVKTTAEVKSAFYRAQGAEQLIEMRRSVVSATDASYYAAVRLHDAGNITDVALANERALREQAKIDLSKAERDALDTREELNALMGVWGPDASTWTIAPRLPNLPASEADLTHLESWAISRRADLSEARQEVIVAAQNLGLTRSTALFPDVTAGAKLEQDADGELTAGPSFQIPVPLFNQGQPAVAAALARFRQSRRRFFALAIEVRAQVRRERDDLLAARDLAEYYRRVMLPLRHQIVEQNQLQFNAMQVGIFELLQSRQAEIDAGREYVQTLESYWVAHAELERAVGGRFDGLKASSAYGRAVPTAATTRPTSSSENHNHLAMENEP